MTNLWRKRENNMQDTLAFEKTIADLTPDTKERMRSEFKRLSKNGQESFEKLFALAYERGKVDGAAHIQGIIDDHKKRMRSLGL